MWWSGMEPRKRLLIFTLRYAEKITISHSAKSKKRRFAVCTDKGGLIISTTKDREQATKTSPSFHQPKSNPLETEIIHTKSGFVAAE